MEINLQQVEAAIVEQAVQKIISDDDLYSRVKTGLEARINKVFADRVSVLLNEKIEIIVKEGFNRSYCKSDGFGRPVGETTSISKEMEGLIQNYWQTRVGRDGKPTDSTYNSMTRAEWMMVQICADDFTKEMKQHVTNVGGALKDHFRGVLNNHVALMLSDVFHVKSAGDVVLKNPGRSSIDPEAKPIGL